MEQLQLAAGFREDVATQGIDGRLVFHDLDQRVNYDLGDQSTLSHVTITESLKTLRKKRGVIRAPAQASQKAEDASQKAEEASQKAEDGAAANDSAMLFGNTRSADSSFVERPRSSGILAAPADSPPRQQAGANPSRAPLRPRQNATAVRRQQIAAEAKRSGQGAAAPPIRAPLALPPWNSNAPDSPFFDPTQDRMRRKSARQTDRSLSKERGEKDTSRIDSSRNTSALGSPQNTSMHSTAAAAAVPAAVAVSSLSLPIPPPSQSQRSAAAVRTAVSLLNESINASNAGAGANVNTSTHSTSSKHDADSAAVSAVLSGSDARKRQLEKIYGQAQSLPISSRGKKPQKARGKSRSKSPSVNSSGAAGAGSPHVTFSASTVLDHQERKGQQQGVVRAVSPPRAQDYYSSSSSSPQRMPAPSRSPIQVPTSSALLATAAAKPLTMVLPPPVPPSLPPGVKITFHRPPSGTAMATGTGKVIRPPASATRIIQGQLPSSFAVVDDLQDHCHHPQHRHYHPYSHHQQQQQQEQGHHHLFSGGALGHQSTLRLSTANEVQSSGSGVDSRSAGVQQAVRRASLPGSSTAAASAASAAAALASTHDLRSMLGKLEAAEEAEAEVATRIAAERAKRSQMTRKGNKEHQVQQRGEGEGDDELGLDVALALSGQASALGRISGGAGATSALDSLPLNVLMAAMQEDGGEATAGMTSKLQEGEELTQQQQEDQGRGRITTTREPRYASPLSQPLNYPSERELVALRNPPQRQLVGWLEAIAAGNNNSGSGGLFVTDSAVQQASQYASSMSRVVRVREATMDEAGLSMRAVVADAAEGILRELLGQVGDQLEEALDEVAEALIEAA
jgi:hypothetical protein